MTTTTDAELRAARRDRVFDAMAAQGIDVAVLGRRDSVAYATGMRALWTAGTRPFGPACVLVGRHRATHLLSTWDDGVPPEVPFEHLYGVTWNPVTMAGALRAIPGLPQARRVGVDAWSPGFARALGRLAPEGELVAVDDLLRRARAAKLPGEVDRISAAVATARTAVDAALGVLRDGAGDAAALGAGLRAAAARGATVPSSEPELRLLGADGALAGIDVGLVVDGYEGGIGRTVALDGREEPRLAELTAAHQRLVGACRPGATAPDLRAAASRATGWIVRGSGMGFEPPVVTGALGANAALSPGMVLSVEVILDGLRHRDLVLVGEASTDTF